jgi:acyl-CoA dehydrogenase
LNSPTVPDTSERAELRRAVRELCDQFGESIGSSAISTANIPRSSSDADQGRLSIGVDTDRVWGLGLGINEAAIILEEINRSGGHAAACHAQMYTMAALLRHGSEEQRSATCPR